MAQKYSLLNEYRNEVISFSRIFFEIVSDAIALRIRANAPNMETEEIDKIASRLSSLVDTGRFLFPNDISHANAFGFEKGPAYAGRRSPPLDAILAACYAVQAMKSSNKKYMRMSLLELQKTEQPLTEPICENDPAYLLIQSRRCYLNSVVPDTFPREWQSMFATLLGPLKAAPDRPELPATSTGGIP